MHDLFNSTNFPKHLLDRATLRGSEFAWRLDDIPSVIKAVEAAGYVNIGGQLQFRLHECGTCECYEVEVNTGKTLEKLDRSKQVSASAAEALRQFERLPYEFDFIVQGRAGFGKFFDEHGVTESDIREAMCFA